MFEANTGLKSFATEVIGALAGAIDPIHRRIEVDAECLPNHRLEYLDIEGEISGNRGRVYRVIRGTYEVLADEDHQFSARLTWNAEGSRRQAEATFYRNLRDEEDCCFSDAWRLRLAL